MSAALESAGIWPIPPAVNSRRCPIDGEQLTWDGGHFLIGASRRWPVIDGIAYLRAGRERLVAAVVALLDAGDVDAATVLLLGDREDAATGPEPDRAALRILVARRDQLGFREAMRLLSFGAASDYFAHRWSDPTYLSGLALAEAYWRPRPHVMDLACGTGHFLRALGRMAPRALGADLVFAKLWLARHFVSPAADLVCFDAARPWPLEGDSAGLLFCHDALDLLDDKPLAVAEMRRVAGARGAILCGHARTALADPAPRGTPLDPAGYVALFGEATLYDDRELTAALVARAAPRPRAADALATAAAISIAAGSAAHRPPAPALGMLDTPSRGAALRRNPLYCEEPDGTCVRHFPSPSYAEEYGSLVTYPPHVTARARVIAGAEPCDDVLVRRRVWLDLPTRW